ncbi:hypothetical protein ABPG75_013698 [Micractinium tetrahymenae]
MKYHPVGVLTGRPTCNHSFDRRQLLMRWRRRQMQGGWLARGIDYSRLLSVMQMHHKMPRGSLLLAALLLAAAAAAPAAALTTSSLWGAAGEKWDPAGLLPDFSFAGYKQGNVDAPPTPAVTKNVTDFRKASMDDTAMIKAAIKWANAQPAAAGWVVLALPRGRLTLKERVFITRSNLVLRGAGLGQTVLYVPKSLTGVYGPNPNNPKTGAYVYEGGFITIQGDLNFGNSLARVKLTAKKGTKRVVVDTPAAIKVGEYYDLLWQDVDGKFNKLMYNNLMTPPSTYKGQTRVRFVTKVVAKAGNVITLERYLPYTIQGGINVVDFHQAKGAVRDSGVEGITFQFAWQLYAGHHLEKGWNAVYLTEASDCWVRNIGTVNADNVVLIYGSTGITVSGVRMEVSKTRANNIPNRFNERADADGHWGVEFGHSFDILVQGLDVRCSMMHDVGTDTSSKFSVVMDSKLKDGNLDLHRGLSGPTLYTNIDVGRGTNALYSGGPSRSGANAAAGTTWWFIQSDIAVDPSKSSYPAGSCDFGPVINLVGVNIKATEAKKMCKTWLYERSVDAPRNLYKSQLARRRALAAAAQRG